MTMTLTAPGCGMGEAIADDACDKLLVLPTWAGDRRRGVRSALGSLDDVRATRAR